MTNFYQNYPSYFNPQQYAIPQQSQYQTASQLNGKIVDSADIVKATEVPFGGFGVFPRGDLSEVYIKSWNNNGTTQITTFKPIVQEPQIDTSALLLEKINNIEQKLSQILTQPKEEKQQEKKIVQPTSQEIKRKESIVSAY